MNRRHFLQNVAVASAVAASVSSKAESLVTMPAEPATVPLPDTQGHTLVCTFNLEQTTWKVYEDLRTREGVLTFISAHGQARVLGKSAEATFAEADPPHLGLSMNDIGLADADLLADRLLAGNGDPDPEKVRAAAPPLGSAAPATPPGSPAPNPRTRWTTFVGTVEAYDVAPVYYGGNTRTYHPVQVAPELRDVVNQGKVIDGLVGGWMPAVRKVMPVSDTVHYEVIVFGDVEAHDKFIVQTWHRTARFENGKMVEAVYGYSYPSFPPRRVAPKAEEFYRALLVFANYWDRQLREFAFTSLPDNSWVEMSKHAFAKELMIRPGGTYPKYGAVDRDYFGSEYDGFQDIFTMAVYTQLEWGRFETARKFIDNYFTDFVDARGMVNMRGPETAQFGLTLSLLARYFNYTRDAELILKHRAKIAATAELLAELHDLGLRLPPDSPGYGLIHGWSESDACLANDPKVWWQPYFANSAFAARGFQDIARAWQDLKRSRMAEQATEWQRRGRMLREATTSSIEKNIKRDLKPPYIGPLPGTKLRFREALAQERPSPQQWPHRPYAELLQADVLPPHLANTVIDCMRAYGATTIGVVANVSVARPGSRAILGFISYGYAQMLLRLDRIEEFLLFLYAHRYHDHTRGSWTAGEVAGINGGTATFCIPAQQTIPLLVRWMLVLEDSDNDCLYFAKGVPRDWVASRKEIKIEQAPTRWGRVNFSLLADTEAKKVVAKVQLAQPGEPKEIQVKLRLPLQNALRSVAVNGRPASLSG
ncbi:MAG TPA: hypothetical protein VKD91_11250, partial [Pyrinomonadaceae bacterium]|nr:hypothetical protein [Pyrinomonadaceae bacterium]